MMPELFAPFPYFGGKRKAAAEVWRRFGDVKNLPSDFEPNPARETRALSGVEVKN